MSSTENEHLESRERKPQYQDQYQNALITLNQFTARKSISQGLIDLALFTSNMSQLKSVLLAGTHYQFYNLMVCLLGASFFLQATQAILLMYLCVACDFEKEENHKRAKLINNCVLLTTTMVTLINTTISSFDITVSPRAMEPVKDAT